MEKFNIRVANEFDFDRIFQIWLENQRIALGKTFNPNDVEVFKKDLFHQFFRTPRSILYVAESEQTSIIGWQALLPLISNPLIGKYTAQSSTYVDREFSNNNVGSKLVEYALVDAKRLGIDHIYGWVKSDNNATNKISENFKVHKYSIPRPTSENLPDFNLYVVIVE